MYCDEVDCVYVCQGCQGLDLVWYVGELDIYVDGDGGDFGDIGYQLEELVVLVGDEVCQWVQVVFGVLVEGIGYWIVYCYFVEGVYDYQDCQVVEDVGDYDGWVGYLDGFC